MPEQVKITFGIIVLNGEPFIRYLLRSLYPFAHQIVVVEGACPTASEVATSDGHSTDGTVESLRQFKENEDPENKLLLVSAANEGYSDGFWPEKDEMSRAYATRATGNYLWQVDSDEFYHEDQMKKIVGILEQERPDAVSFPMLTFWGGLDYLVNSFYLIRDNAREYHRLFAWGEGYQYSTHRPPTVMDARGVDTRSKRWLRAKGLEKMGVFLYHYSLLFPLQVFNKVSYYKGRVTYAIDSWEESVYRRLDKPFRVHNVSQHIGWLERFPAEHPHEVSNMMSDIRAGKIDVELRDCEDVERLLNGSGYYWKSRLLKFVAGIMSRQPFLFLYKVYASVKFRMDL